MRRELIGSGVLCLAGLLLIVFFFPYAAQPSGATGYFSYGTPSRYIGSVAMSEVPHRLVTGRSTTIQTLNFEIDWVPENGILLTLEVSFQKDGSTLPAMSKAWRFSFSNSTTSPYKMIVPLTVFMSNEDLSLLPGETEGIATVTVGVEVIKEAGNTESAPGSYSEDYNILFVNEHPLVAFFTINAFGIGLGLLSAGVAIATLLLTMKLREEWQTRKAAEISDSK